MSFTKILATTIALALMVDVAIAENGGKVVAFCGSASEGPLEEAAKVFERRTGTKVELIWGGSGTVLAQMKLSRRGDLYIPGSPDFMAKALREGLVDASSERILAYLLPVIAVPKGNPQGIRNLADLARPGLRLAIGNPETVCVGLYGVEVLAHAGLLESVGKNIVTHAASCADVASLLVLRKVDAVLGWDVFSSWNPERIEVIALPPEQIPRIAYIPAAITATFAQNRGGARAFLDFLQSGEGRAIFAKWGYLASAEDARKQAPQARIGGEFLLSERPWPFVK